MMGTKAIKTASITTGRRPVTTPKITVGMELIHLSQVNLAVR